MTLLSLVDAEVCVYFVPAARPQSITSCATASRSSSVMESVCWANIQSYS